MKKLCILMLVLSLLLCGCAGTQNSQQPQSPDSLTDAAGPAPEAQDPVPVETPADAPAETLTETPAEGPAQVPAETVPPLQGFQIAATQASDAFLSGGAYHERDIAIDDSPIPILIQTGETVTNVTFDGIQFSEDGTGFELISCSLQELTPDKPLVVWASFPDDTSAYSLIVTDSSGREHLYCIDLSSGDGAVTISKFQ